MFGKKFELNDVTLSLIEEFGKHMPGGFFIYKAEGDGEILYANRAVFDIMGCSDPEEFKILTGNTFKGMVHPEDYEDIYSSIKDQIGEQNDSVDYVEYRIIRPDGSVRWVDDYGQYTETDAYGGIFYVFISDITEKHEQMQSDMAVRQAVIEALSEVYHTMWLINDLETETFSLYRGDTTFATVHAAPIKDALNYLKYSQAKEFYIKTTVAPCDQERLTKELTLTNIAEKLKNKSQYNVNYLRVMNDGSERYFRIEFARVNMPGGKMGIVCGFKDIDEDMRAELKVQQMLEERIRLQEDLIRQQQAAEQQAKMITAMASDYRCVYYVTLDDDEGVCYRTDHSFEDFLELGERFSFSKAFTHYSEFVAEPYREGFLEFIKPENIRAALAKELMITYRYLRVKDGVEKYEMLRMAGVRRPEDRDDHVVHAVGVGFTDIDQEMRESMARNMTLSEALKVAEAANRAKTAFLSNMSHEIRTPMNAIIGLDSIALNNPDLSEETRTQLEKIGDSAQHLLGIINDILDMSRIESGRMTINNEEFSFAKVLEQVNTMIQGQCRDKGLEYECHINGHVSDYYIGDDMKIRQIMLNILGNAVKFTPQGGKVTFLVEEAARYDDKVTLKFTFKDTGIGMSPEYLPKLFDAFSQEDSSTTSKYGSTGLGMPITKNMVELMNGSIEVESEKGVGTTFTVVITLTESDRKAVEGEKKILHPHEMSVLVIDDDPIACEHAKLVLGQVGISCDSALTGAEGIEMVKLRHARVEPYNLILVDWKMPGMDGIETTRKIREIVGHESAIIILTSYSWDGIVDEAKEAGVDAFVPKPLFAATVMDEFREAFRKRGEMSHHDMVELKGRRILLAEDVDINAEIIMMILSMKEIEVDRAENGKIAVDKFASHESGYYDAILMDMRMPVMDGLEATKAIREMGRDDAQSIPIIALTANAFDEDVQRSMQAGLNAHLSKPVEPDNLFETLENLIK